MDFLDPKKKRAHNIRLYVGYVLMGIVILFGTLTIGFFSFGFNIDPKTGNVIQNGLVIIDAHPEAAQVFVNGKDEGSTAGRLSSGTRLVLPAENYDITLKRDGYRSWQHSLSVDGGSIDRLVYPFLFPEKLTSKDAQLFTQAPSLATQSPDRRWLVTQQPGAVNIFSVVDLNDKNVATTTITLPVTLLNQAGAKHDISLVEWSTDNRHVMFKHAFDGGIEFLLFDRQGADGAVNISKHFNRAIDDLTFRDKKYDQYYLHDITTGDLVSAKLANKEIIQVASKVIKFRPHGSDVVLYVVDDGTTPNTVRVHVRVGDSRYILRELPKSQTYLIDLARFDGKWYVAAGTSSDQRVYVYIDPFDDLQGGVRKPIPSVLLRLNAPLEHVSFSTNARFIEVQSGGQFAVYDAETKRQYRYDTKLALSAGYEAKWMDGHRLTAVSDGKLQVFDFDGTNLQALVSTTVAYEPFFNRDYTQLFTVSPSTQVKDKTALINTNLRVVK